MNDRIFRQRALGVVIGSAFDDALGAPFEFRPPGQYSARFPEPVIGGIGEMVGGGGFGADAVDDRGGPICKVVSGRHDRCRTSDFRSGWDEPTVTAHLAEHWPHLGLWNESLNDLLHTWR